MRMHVILRTLVVFLSVVLLMSCIRMEDFVNAQKSITPDLRIEGQWVPVFWMDQKDLEKAIVTLTKIERDGHTGYKFLSSDPKLQEDLDSFWGFDFDGTKFFTSDYPDENCKMCELIFYEIKDEMLYAYILKTAEAQIYMSEKYPDNKKLLIENSGEWSKDIVIKILDDESKSMLKDFATHSELWENAVILKRADLKH